MKFLIDECLSPTLATIARKRGFPQSTHVSWLGLRSRKDWLLVRRAIRDGYVLVTNDTADFTSLMEREHRHPGLVCMNVAHGLMSLDVHGVAPFLWTPSDCAEEVFRWRELIHPTRRNTGARWLSWFARETGSVRAKSSNS